MASISEVTRKYQFELTELAIASNIIIVLDTGSGKTHIAARLLSHYENLELQSREETVAERVSFFLVPTVTLVEQQTEYVARTLRKPPMPICGAMNNMDRWNRDSWRELLQKHTVIVCTGEILNQALAKRYVTISEMNLIVFDEAHHAKAGHPYAIVMKRYKESVQEPKPRIIGMTASPVESTDRIEQDLAKLERLLEAKITTSSGGSLLEHVHRPREEEWEYSGLRMRTDTLLWAQIQPYVQMDALAKTRHSAMRAAAELGPWCADRVWYYAFEQVQLLKLQRKIEGDEWDNPRPRPLVDAELQNLNSAVAIVKAHNFHAAVQEPASVLTSKVMVLHEKLQAEFSRNSIAKCIVFVRERSSARALFDVFRRLLQVKGMVPTYLVGMGSNEAGDAINSWNQQKATMRAFRNGVVNCIFATQVAEEGVDIPACNLVVRFNPYADIIQYVQSRGRARMRDSVYAVMSDKSVPNIAAECKYIRDCEQWLREYYANLQPDRLVNLREATLRSTLASKYGDQYFETATGARCDLDNSLSFLEHYAGSLQYENIAANRLRWMEMSDKKFVYIVHVPIDASRALCPSKGFSSEIEFREYMSTLPSNGGAKVITISGLEIYHKGYAKRSAALNACWMLRALGLLDENLDTVHKRKLEAMDHVKLPTMEKALEFPVKVRADFWDEGTGNEPEFLYATVVSVSSRKSSSIGHSPIVLFTRFPLSWIPPFPLLLEDESEVVVSTKPYPKPIQIESYDLDLLTMYTLDGVYADVFNKGYEKDVSRMQYWLAPSLEAQESVKELEDIVDLARLGAIKKGYIFWNAQSRDPQVWCNKFLVGGGPLGKWTYFSGMVTDDIHIDSPVPATAVNVPNKNSETVFKFTASSSSAWKGYHHEIDEKQPVLDAVMTSFRRDFRIAARKEERLRKSTPCRICPQPLKVSPIGPDLAKTFLLFPSIWCHINDRLLATELLQRIDLQIPVELTCEALTYVTEEDTNQLEFDTSILRHPNKDYERLEFYGDTFLKLAIVLILFIKLDKETALNYHVKKKELISNHNLSNVVRHLGVHKYMRSGQVERRECWPATLTQKSGKKPRREAEDGTVMRSLHQKSIADVAESLIGASLLSNYRKPNRFDQPLQAVTKFVQSPYHDISTWSAYHDLYNPPIWQAQEHTLVSTAQDAVEISNILGYNFRHPNLVRSALTHKSYSGAKSGVVPNYERLEILGDGLHDMTVADFLFHKYPNRGPQFLTEHKDVMVSNKFMAHLCVKLGLYRYILYASSAATVARCNSYVHQYRDAVEDEGRVRENSNFWYELDSEPKMFADVIESLVGAMFVDAEFDFGVVQGFFDRHVRPYFDDESSHTEVAHAHPVTLLLQLLKRRFRCYGFHAETTTNTVAVRPPSLLDPDDPSRHLDPQVRVELSIHGHPLASALASSGKVAKARAARAGAQELRAISTPREFLQRFGCGCKWHDWEAEDAEGENDENFRSGAEPTM